MKAVAPAAAVAAERIQRCEGGLAAARLDVDLDHRARGRRRRGRSPRPAHPDRGSGGRGGLRRAMLLLLLLWGRLPHARRLGWREAERGGTRTRLELGERVKALRLLDAELASDDFVPMRELARVRFLQGAHAPSDRERGVASKKQHAPPDDRVIDDDLGSRGRVVAKAGHAPVLERDHVRDAVRDVHFEQARRPPRVASLRGRCREAVLGGRRAVPHLVHLEHV